MRGSRAGTGYLLWQRRFREHSIRDDSDLAKHVDCIHDNPVKPGYVTSPADWPYSFLHRYIRDGVPPPDWGAGVANVHDGFGEPDI
jgi:putative transposase